MKVDIDEIGACKKSMRVEVPAEDMENRLNEQLKEFAKNAQIRGFRPGHIPRHIIERRYLKKIIEEMREVVAAEVFEEAVRERKLRIIGAPKIEDIEYERGNPLSFRAEFFVLPEVTLPPYKRLRLTIPDPRPTPEDVEKEIERMQELDAELVDVEDRASEDGDRLLAEITVTVDDREVFKSGHGYLVVGMKNMFGVSLEQLPELLRGKRLNDEVEFEFEIPEGSPLAGKENADAGKRAVCKMRILRIRQRKLPSADDEFAKKAGYTSIEDMRKKIADEQTVVNQLRIDIETEERLLDHILDSIDVEMPEELLEEKAKLHEEYLRYKLQSEGDMSDEEIEETLKEEREKGKETLKRSLLTHLVVEAVAKNEAIFVTEDEVDSVLMEMARRQGRTLESLKEELVEDGRIGELRTELLEGKVKRFLRENAELTVGDDFGDVEPPPETEKPPEEDSKEEEDEGTRTTDTDSGGA